jgi:transcriptional regulator with XRE-family HTH domain
MDIDLFWKRVKNLAKNMRITQAEIAVKCGIPYDTFRGWIAKNLIPPLEDAYNISRCLDVSLEYLILGRGKELSGKIGKTIALMNKLQEKLLVRLGNDT